MGSNDAAEDGPPQELPELDRLERAVRRLLETAAAWRARAVSAESRERELQTTLDAVGTGALDPRHLSERVTTLDAENQALKERLRRAEVLAHRIHARLQLLEEDR